MRPRDTPSMRLIAGSAIWVRSTSGRRTTSDFSRSMRMAERGGIRVRRPEGKALGRARRVGGHEVVLAKPQTMMNLSGVAVRMLVERYECDRPK